MFQRNQWSRNDAPQYNNQPKNEKEAAQRIRAIVKELEEEERAEALNFLEEEGFSKGGL